MIFKEVCQEFLEHEKNILKFQTYLECERYFRLYIIPFFQNKKVEDITKKDILEWQQFVKNKGLSSRTNNHIKTKLDQLYDYLMLYYDVDVNISRVVPNFEKKSKNRVGTVWTLKDFRKFIKVTKNDIEFSTLFYFLFFTGVRQGEALALKWKDLDTKKVTISKSLSQAYLNGQRISQTTKNNCTRIKSIDFFTSRKLTRLRKYYIKKYPNFNSDFYIFGGVKPLACTTIRRKKNFYCKLAGVKQIRIHDFRHSHGSLLYKKTKDVKLVQEELGHKDATVTINTYVHSFENEKKRVNLLLNLMHINFF